MDRNISVMPYHLITSEAIMQPSEIMQKLWNTKQRLWKLSRRNLVKTTLIMPLY